MQYKHVRTHTPLSKTQISVRDRVHTDKEITFYHSQNGNRCSSAQRRLDSVVSFLRGPLNLATFSELRIRPEEENGDEERQRKREVFGGKAK